MRSSRNYDDTVQLELPGMPGPWRSIPALAEILNAGATVPTMTEHALRHYVRHAAKNGLWPHVRRIGRKIIVSEPGFMKWLDSVGG